MDRVKTALFIDFDNVFLSLKNDYSDAVAKRFANPSRWLPWLENGEHAGEQGPSRGQRSLLIRRCYGSPDLMRPFRPYFTRLGFQVVDCPPLTKSGKNSADIVMTLDIADAIEHTTRFDEFVIMSSDADFTPVALRLRAYDRITSILANQQTAAAYRSCCEIVIDMDEFEAVFGEQPQAASSPGAAQRHNGRQYESIRREVTTAIREELASAREPVAMPALAGRIRERWPIVAESNWLQAGGFKKFLAEVADEHMRFSSAAGGLVYDARRHTPPTAAHDHSDRLMAEPPIRAQQMTEPIRDLADRLYEVVNLPRLDSRQYQTVFAALAAQSGRHTTLGEITKSARDTALGEGASIGRQPFAFVARALHLAGLSITETQTEPGEIARLFRSSVHQQAHDAQLELEDEDLRLLDELLGVAVRERRASDTAL